MKAAVLEQVGAPMGAFFFRTCGLCQHCLDGRETACHSLFAGPRMSGSSVNGGYAEFMATRAEFLMKLPDELQFTDAACGATTVLMETELELMNELSEGVACRLPRDAAITLPRSFSSLWPSLLIGLVAAAACSREQTADPAAFTAPSERAALGVGPHDGGPSGSVVFYSRRDGPAKIYAMNADGTDVTRVTDGPGNDVWPDISPNGRQIVFASNRSGNNEVYVLDLADGALTNVSNSPADDSWPRWSPNGRQIVFHSNRAGNYDIYLVNADGTGLHAITTNTALDQWPDWSPDGRRIAFRRDNDVYVADADGVEQNVRRLTFAPTVINQMPAWSPDGQRIAFMSLREGYCAVFLMNADGTNPVNLTPKRAADPASAWCSRAPSWSRNGRIYFMSIRTTTSGDAEIFSMTGDGSDLTRLTTSLGEDGGPRVR